MHTGHFNPRTLDLITALYSCPQVLHFHQTFLVERSLTSSGNNVPFFCDHSNASCGWVYSRYETGSRQPSIDILIQLADIFGVTVDYLLGRQDIEDSTLSEYELSLLIASRKADERAKQDALNMLLAHAVKTNQKN